MSNTRYNVSVSTDMSGKKPKLLYVSTSKYENDWSSIFHSHHFSELFFILNGSGTFSIDNQILQVAPSDLVIVNPNVEHTEKSLDGSPLEYIVFGIDGLSFSLKSLDTEEVISAPFFLHSYRDEDSNLPLYVQIMLKEVTDKAPGYELICQHLLDIILTCTSRWQHITPTADTSPKLNKECALIKRYLDSHYAENVTLDLLAQMTHMNKYYIVHAFTKHTGMSPINYLLNKRIQEGKNLLQTTTYSIAQISSSLGFSSQSYFAQAFKRLTGMTPNQYRHESKESL